MTELFKQRFLIDSRDVDGQAQCRPSALLGFLQEAATNAAEKFGFGRIPMLERYGAVWVITRTMLHMNAPLRWQDELTIQTWHRGGKSAIMYRDYDLLVDGKAVGEAVSMWVLLHLDTGRVEKLSGFTELDRNYGGERCKDVVLNKLRLPTEPILKEQRLMRYSDSDMNGHVNNTRYADFICDALHLEKREQGEFVARLQVNYLNQCWPGETLTLLTAEQGKERFVVGRDEEGKGRFEARVTLDNLSAIE